jgi:hypothetical protein
MFLKKFPIAPHLPIGKRLHICVGFGLHEDHQQPREKGD